MSEYPKPSLSIVSSLNARGNRRPAYFLEYKGESLKVSPTEYVLLQGLLSEQGLDLHKASEARNSLEGKTDSNPITGGTARVVLVQLRNKINKKFPNLVIPIQKGSVRISGVNLKLFTPEQIAEIHQSLTPKEGSTYVAFDEHGQAHLFFNGTEIKSHNKGVFPQHLALAAMMICNWRAFNAENIWKELTGAVLQQDSLRISVRLLRRALEPAGWTISRRPRTENKVFGYKLIPYTP